MSIVPDARISHGFFGVFFVCLFFGSCRTARLSLLITPMHSFIGRSKSVIDSAVLILQRRDVKPVL